MNRRIPPDFANPRVVRRLQRLALYLTVGVGAWTLAVFVAGWGLGASWLRSLHPSLASMKANTALSFVLAATALWLLQRREATHRHRRIAELLAVAVAGIGTLTLSQDAFGWNLGIDELIFNDVPGARTGAPGRMSPATAVSFALLGVSLLLLGRGSTLASGGTQALALLVGTSGLLAVVGHAYGARDLYAVPGYTSMALHTALAFGGLAVATLCARPQMGPMRIVSANTTAGALTRHLLPAVVVIPLVVGWLRLRGEQAGLYPAAFGVALFAVANILCIGGLTWLTAGRLLRSELARRHDQEALAESERRIATTLDSIGDGVIATDVEGRVIRMNPVAEQLTGWKARDAVGLLLSEVFPIESEISGRPAENPVARVLQEGTIVGLANHTALVTRDGRRIPIADSGAPIRSASGEIEGVVLVFRDQTEERRAAAALRASEARKAAVLDASLDSIISIDRAGIVTEFNPAAEKTFGCTRGEAVGKPLADLIIPLRLREAHRQGIERYRATGEARVLGRRLELPAMRADGSEFPAEVAIVAVTEGGEPSFTGFIRDLTEEKHALEMRIRSAELQAENWRLQEASRLKSEFLAHMSHELRTPMNAVIGFAELLHDGKVGAPSVDQRELLDDILTSARHLLRLINDILDLSKLEAGKLEFHPEPVMVESVVGEVAAVLRSLAVAKGIRLSTEVDPDLGTVEIDAVRFRQVLYNYLSNALKFTPDAGAVVVRARVEDATRFRLEVEDTGPGIAPESVKKLFVQFEQLPAGGPSGTGLGLALTKRLVEAQGGAVGVQSTPGRGSTFYALFPREARARAALPPSRRVEGPHATAPVVLIVEDDPDDQALLVRTLTSAGYGVETATTRAQALARCRERTYAAITLDLLLPDGSGLALLEAIRAGSRNQDVPVVVVSVVAEKAAGFGIHDALSKPLHPERLLASLKRADVLPGRDGHVLVVDDDLSSLRLMEATLRQLGYRATCAPDGERGLREATASRPLAVVLDLLMPGMDGFAFLERFRRTPQNREIPVIVWTAKDLSEAEERLLSASARAVVQKQRPVDETLVEILRAGGRTRASTH